MGEKDIREEVVKEEDIIKETWGNMSFGKKLEYLWMYYKSWLFAAVILVGLICLGVNMYKGMHTKVLLNAVVIGGDSQKAQWLEEAFVEFAGIEEKDGEVRIRANIPDDKGGATSKTALTTLLGANAVDVLVCSESVFYEYADQEGFLEIEELLGENPAGCGDAVSDYGVLLKSGNILEQEAMTSYDKIYAAVPVNSKNPKTAVKFIEFLLQ
ncbi:hypothetical protein IMSAGC018_02102 [Lachnospiraceae bacterium]|nr:hypothetical protein IMSAGC018_02102 [Lachnospiraceae bacterium]